MTKDKIKELDELIAAVERGDPNKSDGTLCHLFGDDWVHAWDVIGWGSLDAAKALHDALLPEWGYRVSPSYTLVLKPKLIGDYDRFSASTDDNPARAWLIAILKAYRSTLST